MPDTNAELHQLLSDIQRVLIQEKELFGDTLYTNPEPPTPTPEGDGMPSHKKVIPVVEGPDLFGVVPTPQAAQEKLPDFPAEPWVSAPDIRELNSQICTCLKCSLGSTRIKFVFGVGNPDADIVS